MLRGSLAVVPPWRWWLGFGFVGVVGAVVTTHAYREGLPAIFDAFKHFDKICHFSFFGLLAFFLDGALRRKPLAVAGLTVPFAAIAILVPAGIEEFMQRFAILRTSSFGDFAADVVGVCLFIPLSRRSAQ